MADTIYTNTGGLRQDLLNALKTIQEAQTPLVSRLKSSVATQKLHEWPSDRINVATTNNAAVEGADFSAAAVQNFTQSTNYCQIVRQDFAISGSMEGSGVYAGIASQVAYQKTKSLKKIGMDLEWAILQATGNSGASATSAREMVGLPTWAANAYSAVSATATIAITALGSSSGESKFNDVCQALFNKGVIPDFAYTNGQGKRQVSAWTAKVTPYHEMQDKKLPAQVAIYEGDFGVIEFLYTPNSGANLIVGLMENLRIAYRRRPFSWVQGVRGDSWPVIVLGEATLEVLDPLSVGVVALT